MLQYLSDDNMEAVQRQQESDDVRRQNDAESSGNAEKHTK